MNPNLKIKGSTINREIWLPHVFSMSINYYNYSKVPEDMLTFTDRIWLPKFFFIFTITGIVWLPESCVNYNTCLFLQL